MKRTIILTALLALLATSIFAQRRPTLTDDDVEAAKKPKVEEKTKPSETSSARTNSTWIEVAPALSGFKILMPAQPKASLQPQDLPMLGTTEFHQLQISDDKDFYQIVYFKLPESKSVNTNSKSFREAFFVGMAKGFMEKVEGELIKDTAINHLGYEGREIQIKTSSAMVWSRMFMINGTMYSLTIGSPNEVTENQKRFFSSFQIK